MLTASDAGPQYLGNAESLALDRLWYLIFQKYLFLSLWLHWVFVAARAALRCGAWTSHCSGFSRCGARGRGCTDSSRHST